MDATDASQKQEQEMPYVESKVRIKASRNWEKSSEHRSVTI